MALRKFASRFFRSVRSTTFKESAKLKSLKTKIRDKLTKPLSEQWKLGSKSREDFMKLPGRGKWKKMTDEISRSSNESKTIEMMTNAGKSIRRSKVARGAHNVGSAAVKMTAPLGHAGVGIARIGLRNPFKMGLAAGAGWGILGAASRQIQEADRMTQYRGKNGMAHNHLGTDGLTLSLSKMRHR